MLVRQLTTAQLTLSTHRNTQADIHNIQQQYSVNTNQQQCQPMSTQSLSINIHASVKLSVIRSINERNRRPFDHSNHTYNNNNNNNNNTIMFTCIIIVINSDNNRITLHVLTNNFYSVTHPKVQNGTTKQRKD